MIQKETTRLYGPSSVLFIRESAQDQYLKGIPIRKGTYLNVVTANHYNPKYFRDPLVAGYGVGVRSVLFGYFVRLDYGWGIETRQTQDPMLYFSIGMDF